MPGRPSSRCSNSGGPIIVKSAAWAAISEMVLMPKRAATSFFIANACVLFSGAGLSHTRLNCFLYSSRTVLNTCSRFVFVGSFKTVNNPVPVYSGYKSTWSLTNACCKTGVPPRFNLRSTGMPFASSSSAYMLPTMNSSVKSLEPTRTGLGCPPQAASTNDIARTALSDASAKNGCLCGMVPPAVTVSRCRLRRVLLWNPNQALQPTQNNFGAQCQQCDGNRPD